MGTACCTQKKQEDAIKTQHKQAHYQVQKSDVDNYDAKFMREQREQMEYFENQKLQGHKVNASNGVAIGGNQQNSSGNSDELIRQRMGEAAERRAQEQNNRGISKQGQIEYELKIKKLQEADTYERQRNGDYALKVLLTLFQIIIQWN